MPDAWDVSCHFDAVRQANTCDLSKRRIRLLRCLREDAHADAPLLRTHLKRRALRLRDNPLASVANKLTDSRHRSSTLSSARSAYTRTQRYTLRAIAHARLCGQSGHVPNSDRQHWPDGPLSRLVL